MGTWKVIGSTNRWPRVVNLWEMDGWEHWAETLERQFLPAQDRTRRWRRGGRRRPNGAAAASIAFSSRPRTARRCEALQRGGSPRLGLRAHDRAAARPASATPTSPPSARRLTPLLAARGLALMGAYAVPMRTDEAVLLWAAPDFRHLCRLYAERERDAELRHGRAGVDRLAAERRDDVAGAVAGLLLPSGVPQRRRGALTRRRSCRGTGRPGQPYERDGEMGPRGRPDSRVRRAFTRRAQERMKPAAGGLAAGLGGGGGRKRYGALAPIACGGGIRVSLPARIDGRPASPFKVFLSAGQIPLAPGAKSPVN